MKHLVEIGCRGVSSLHNFIPDADRLEIIEPVPANIEAIRLNYGDEPKVQLHPVAVWHTPGTITMHNLGALSYVEGITQPPAVIGFGYQKDEALMIDVAAVTFDMIDDGTIDMLDLDMEGSEYYALARMISRPEVIIVELDSNQFRDEIWAWMNDNNYRMFGTKDDGSCFFKKRSATKP